MIPMEIEEVNSRIENPLPTESNGKAIRENVFLSEEKRMVTSLTSEIIKQRISYGYNR